MQEAFVTVLAHPEMSGLACCLDLAPYDGFLVPAAYEALAMEARNLAGQRSSRRGSAAQLQDGGEHAARRGEGDQVGRGALSSIGRAPCLVSLEVHMLPLHSPPGSSCTHDWPN
jgi:hypothetical protein